MRQPDYSNTRPPVSNRLVRQVQISLSTSISYKTFSSWKMQNHSALQAMACPELSKSTAITYGSHHYKRER